MFVLLPLLSLLACTSGDPDVPAESCGDPDRQRVSVVTSLVLARETDGISAGFDLDGEQSSEDGSTGCGIGDYQSPDGRTGIDNALARLMPALDQTEAVAVDGLIQQIINTGELLIMFETTGLDDPNDDECVDVSIWRGMGAPDVGTHGLINDGQTFDRDTSQGSSHAYGVSLQEGVLMASGLRLELPLQVFEATVDLVLEDASIRLEYAPDGTFVGSVGGSLDPQIIMNTVNNAPVDAGVVALLGNLLSVNTDLDHADGDCTRLSATVEIAGTSAWFYDDDLE